MASPAGDVLGAVLTLFRGTGLLEALAQEVAHKLRQDGAADGAGAWVSQKDSPLGRRKHLALCRAGELAGARKTGKSWLVRRTVIDAWIDAQGTTSPASAGTAEDEHDLEAAVDRAAAAAGLVRAGPVRRPARRAR